MNVHISIEQDSASWSNAMSELTEKIPKGAEEAAARAFNRALDAGRAAIVREVRKNYEVRAKDVRGTIWVQRASKWSVSSGGGMVAAIGAKGSALPLRAFAHRPTSDTTGAKRKPVRVSIQAGHPFTAPGGFIWRGNIFYRKLETRLPIKKASGPSVPSMIGRTDIADKIYTVMLETAEQRLEHELNRLAEGKK